MTPDLVESGARQGFSVHESDPFRMRELLFLLLRNQKEDFWRQLDRYLGLYFTGETIKEDTITELIREDNEKRYSLIHAAASCGNTVFMEHLINSYKARPDSPIHIVWSCSFMPNIT
jgi:hypothetical protein